MDVRSMIPARDTGQPNAEPLASGFPDLRLDGRNPLKYERITKCRAMSEQSADGGRGNDQMPQKLVHLVGYRDPNAVRSIGSGRPARHEPLTSSPPITG
ncbi:hypothetical protein [uncultured Bradyrhizobium sp.]|uniref:hypothetical protein n=1 Tax=uncultured Bradyrhizobium sp. TaxID=199684 RepID=UPI0035CB5D22